MIPTNLDNLIKVNLRLGATQAEVADVTTVLALVPSLATHDILTFMTLEDALADPAVIADATEGAAEVARTAFAQDGVTKVKLTGLVAASYTTPEARLTEILAADRGWLALHTITDPAAPEPHLDGAPALGPLAFVALSKAFDDLAGGNKLLIGDVLLAGVDPVALDVYAATKDHRFTAMFAADNAAAEIGRSMHGLASAANRLAMDADRKKAAWSWFGLKRAVVSELPPGFVAATSDWVNVYGRNRGVDIVARGVTTRGEPIHAIVAAIWAAARIGESITNAMVRRADNFGSLDYDNAGIGVVRAAIDVVLQRAVALRHAVDGSPRINVPDVEDVSETDLVAGHLPAKAGFRVLGSIVSVELDLLASMNFEPADIGLPNDEEQ